jgi:hypothetical protein
MSLSKKDRTNYNWLKVVFHVLVLPSLQNIISSYHMYSRVSRIDQKRVKNCPKLQMNIKELLTTKKGEIFIFKQHVLRSVYK